MIRPWLLMAALAIVPLAAACERGGASGSNGPAPAVEVGEKAPAFALPSVGGKRVSLTDYMRRKAVLLYFSMGPG
jgi:hypothetical protein